MLFGTSTTLGLFYAHILSVQTIISKNLLRLSVMIIIIIIIITIIIIFYYNL